MIVRAATCCQVSIRSRPRAFQESDAAKKRCEPDEIAQPGTPADTADAIGPLEQHLPPWQMGVFLRWAGSYGAAVGVADPLPACVANRYAEPAQRRRHLSVGVVHPSWQTGNERQGHCTPACGDLRPQGLDELGIVALDRVGGDGCTGVAWVDPDAAE